MAGRKRLMSQPEVKAAESAGNLNVEWMTEKHWWPTYLALIVGLRLLILYFAPYLDQPGQWTLTNVSHGVITFWALHWNRGSPVWKDQGEHVDQTVWEQIDNGVPWTETRKFFIIVPILLYLVTCYAVDWDHTQLWVNSVTLAVCVVAKLPEMHGVRILQINSARVD